MRLRLLRGMIDNSHSLLKRKPTAMTPPHLMPSSRAVSQIIVDMGDNEEDDPTAENVFKFIDGLAPDTLTLLDHELHSAHADRVHHLVTDLVYNDKTSKHVREAKLREYLILIDDEDRTDLDMNLALIEGLHCMPLLEQHDDMTKASQEHLDRCRALIIVTRAAVEIKEERGVRVHDQIGVVFLTEPHLIKLVLANTSRARQIAEFIASRRELHAEVIANMLENTPPLAPGTL